MEGLTVEIFLQLSEKPSLQRFLGQFTENFPELRVVSVQPFAVNRVVIEML